MPPVLCFSGIVCGVRAFLVQLPVTNDTDVFWYAVGGIVLLLVGALLVRFADRRRR